MKVNIKKLHKDAVIPVYAKPGDAGLDLTATSVEYNGKYGTIEYGTGLAFEIPEGHVGLLFPRSSNKKKELFLTNHVGVLDSGYRGEVKFAYKPDVEYWCEVNEHNFQSKLEEGEFHYYESATGAHRDNVVISEAYAVGDRIGQIIIVPYPQIEFNEVYELSETERGEGGYGSTGK